jgi:S-adenosylmethionine:tRNA ribosyltransferase-isomerase
MMVLQRHESRIEGRFFYDIDSYLDAGDILVVNDSKVIPARLTGRKDTGGEIEILLLTGDNADMGASMAIWDVLLRPAKRVREGTRIHFGTAGEGRVMRRLSDKKWRMLFSTPGSFQDFLRQYGTAPLPPYIKRKRKASGDVNDIERYQTIYARTPGSVAAPTAGFHFSPRVMEKLASRGVSIVPVTLHVGYGTFLPIETEEIENHRMEEETFELKPEAARLINSARRVIAVGTTATRVLESLADDTGTVRPATGATNLFIYPGYRFKRVNGLLTNFHLPKSSLFLLASAFAGLPLLQKAYQLAIADRYRFYSYGDCTLIL